MNRIDIFSVKPLLAYGDQHQIDIPQLAEWVGLCWDSVHVSEWMGVNKSVVERSIDEGIMEMSDGELKCTSPIYFEYLYAVHFSKNTLIKLNGNWNEIYKAAWNKRHCKKNKNGVPLESDFLSLVIIAMRSALGIDIIEAWLSDMDTHFAKHYVSLEKVLPLINPTVEQIVKLGLAIESKNDHSLNKFALAARATVAQYPELAHDLETKFRSSGSDYLQRLIPWILLGLSDVGGTASFSDRLVTQLKGTDDDKKEALAVLGMAPMDQDNWDQCGEAISNSLKDLFESGDIDLHIKSLNALRNLQPYAKDFTHYVTVLSTKTENEYRGAVIEALWLTADNSCTEPWFKEAFQNASHVDSNLSGLIYQVTWILYPVAEKNPTLFARYLDSWIANDKNEIKSIRLFDDVINKFFDRHPDEASKWLTLAFMNPNERFHQSLMHVISELWVDGKRFLSLHKPTLDASKPELIRYALFKVCGYVYSKEPLESLVYSLLTRTPFRADITKMIGDAFLQHITFEYGGTNTYLREQLPTANEAQAEVINRVLAFNDQYNQDVQKIRKIPELRLSLRADVNFKQAKMKRLSENMEVGKDERKKNSIMDYVKKVSIKGGRSFFSKHDNKYHPPAKMGHFESSFEMPMGESIDMVKDKLKILHWKQFKFPE